MEPALVSADLAERIVEVCRDIVGEQLRSVTYFTRDDFDQLYLRDDLQRDADLTSFIGVEWRESVITQDAYRGSELGDHRYTIRVFQNGYLLRFTSDHDGVFITTDGLTMKGFDLVATELAGLLGDRPANR